MSDDDQKAIAQHIRGATVVHQSPFSSIDVPSVEDALSEEECEKWVVPFYRVSFRAAEPAFAEALKQIYQELTPTIVEKLLTDYNWRPRLTGAFFAALRRFDSVEDHIGRLLLRSDLCYAGKLYCVALAEFNTPKGLDYLKRYLSYYLTRPELVYDQGDAMGAVAYMDAANGTNHFESFKAQWHAYATARSWSQDILQRSIAMFADEMKALHEYRAQAETCC